MSPPVWWYRSNCAAPRVVRSARRRTRDALLSWLPEPAVSGKTVVVYSRQTFPTLSWRGFRSEFHGLFSEFHSVLGALAYADAHGAAAVRIDFRSPLYVEPGREPNWWTSFFCDSYLSLRDAPGAGGEVHLNEAITRYGRYGGFADIVQGPTPYFYPMTYGLSRLRLKELADAHARVRPEILDEVAGFIAERFEPGAFVVGVHYRGTDAVRGRRGWFTHYRSGRVPYSEYADEIRRVLTARSPRVFQIFVATDELECLDFMRRGFGDRVVS